MNIVKIKKSMQNLPTSIAHMARKQYVEENFNDAASALEYLSEYPEAAANIAGAVCEAAKAHFATELQKPLTEAESASVPRRGRPKGSKNRPKPVEETTETAEAAE